MSKAIKTLLLWLTILTGCDGATAPKACEPWADEYANAFWRGEDICLRGREINEDLDRTGPLSQCILAGLEEGYAYAQTHSPDACGEGAEQ